MKSVRVSKYFQRAALSIPYAVAVALTNNESFWRLFISDSTLRRRQRRCTRGPADDSTHSPSSDRLSISAVGRSLAASVDALPAREPRSAGDFMRGDCFADGSSHVGA